MNLPTSYQSMYMCEKHIYQSELSARLYNTELLCITRLGNLSSYTITFANKLILRNKLCAIVKKKK